MPRRSTCLLLLNALVWAPAQAAECGGPVPCVLEQGAYRVVLPEGRPKGAVVFFHGYRGSAEGQMKAEDLIAVAGAHGLAFVAPDGRGGSWSHVGSPTQDRDEQAYFRELIGDLDLRYGIAESDVVVAGFSQGASMAFDVTCKEGRKLAGMISFAGVFWRPLPGAGDCMPPPPVIHFHGRGDTIFPLAGRPIGTRAHQGDTLLSIGVLREAGGCHSADRTAEEIGGVSCDTTPSCGGASVSLCLHDGGHDVRAAWLDAALTRLGR